MNNLVKTGTLGEGSYGIVYEVSDPTNKKTYALKRNFIHKDISFCGALREYYILNTHNRHPNVANLKKAIFVRDEIKSFSPALSNEFDRSSDRDDNIHFLFQKCSFDLKHYIKNYKTDYRKYKKIMCELLLTLEYFHSNNIIHRDITPSNILIMNEARSPDSKSDINIEIQLADFGISKIYTNQVPSTPNTYTVQYRPPELYGRSNITSTKADIWAAGCVFYEMITRKLFFNFCDFASDKMIDNFDFSDAKNVNTILSWLLLTLPEKVSDERVTRVLGNKFVRKTTRKNKVASNSLGYESLLSKYKSDSFEREIGEMKDFCNLLSNMIKFDFEERWTATQCLSSPIFKDMSEHITHMRQYINEKVYPKMSITYGNERKIIREEAFYLFEKIKDHQDREFWCDYRTLFQAISYFDRYMEENSKKESLEIKKESLEIECKTLFWSCVYMAHKFFASVGNGESIDTVIPGKIFSYYKDHGEAVKILEENEYSLIKAMKGDIYRDTLLEAAGYGNSGNVLDRKKKIKLNEIHRGLLSLLLINENLNGKTVIEVYTHYMKNIHTTIDRIHDQEKMNEEEKNIQVYKLLKSNF
jgi:serine/threonine protein kinase